MELYTPEVFGNGKLLGVFTHGTSEWHEARADSIGGSEISTIMGYNPYESAYALWLKKTGQIPVAPINNWAVRFGQAFEGPILGLWQEEHPEYEVFLTGTYQDTILPFRHANPDAIGRHKETGELIVIEVKTARSTWAEVPKGYVAQVQHYMDILDLPKAVIVGVVGMTWVEHWIDRDDWEIENQRIYAAEFQSCIMNGEQPAWDGSEATYEAVRLLHPEITDVEVEIDGLHQLALAQEEFDRAEAKLRQNKSEVLALMGTAKHAYIEVDGQKIRVASRQARGTTGVPFLVVSRSK